jgi:hypothetical protein
VAGFGLPRLFYFPSTHHIWRAFPYPPPGEAPDGRPATPHGLLNKLQTTKLPKLKIVGLPLQDILID